MNDDNQIFETIQSLKRVANNNKFSNFIDNLNYEEQVTYLYIEAQRSNVFLQELTSLKGKTLSIDDLKDEKKRKKVKALLHNENYIQNLIDFWDKFGKISTPSLELKQMIISKYEKYYKALTENEKNFIINC